MKAELTTITVEQSRRVDFNSEFRISRGFRPEGTFENSPAFQCRVGVTKMLSPEGTAESFARIDTIQPSLRDGNQS